MKSMTKDALLSAFGGESVAHMRYLVFAVQAEREGFPNIARLFRAIAHAEYVHASNHYNILRDFDEDAKVVSGAPIGPGTTVKNLKLAIRGEEFEVEEMYPIYIKIAEEQGEKQAVRSFRWALEAEKIHAELYKEALKSAEEGKDFQIKGKVWICPVCGHTYIGEEPSEKCPVCGAPREKYVGF